MARRQQSAARLTWAVHRKIGRELEARRTSVDSEMPSMLIPTSE
jgi:hypothetical protein